VRCTGHCCKAFTLPVTPQEVFIALLSSVLGYEHKYSVGERGVDNMKLFSLLVYVGTEPLRGVPGGPGAHYYTCKALAPSGDCSIYDSRPYTCRDYPYGMVCKYIGCTATKEAA